MEIKESVVSDHVEVSGKLERGVRRRKKERKRKKSNHMRRKVDERIQRETLGNRRNKRMEKN